MDYIANLRKHIGTQPIIMCGANVIIVNYNKQILLHRRTDEDCWGLPGGIMEIGETLEETAKRGVKEEINIDCHNLKLFNVYSGKELYYKYPDGNEVYNVTTTYICTSYSGIIKVEEEGGEAKFFNIEDIPNNLSAPIEGIIKEYLQSAKVKNKRNSKSAKRLKILIIKLLSYSLVAYLIALGLLTPMTVLLVPIGLILFILIDIFIIKRI